MHRHAFAFLILAVAVSARAETTLYVSPGGDDANPGTEAKPFATLVRARDEVRALKKAKRLPDGGAIVRLAPGTYSLHEPFQLTAEHSGTPSGPIVYRAGQRGTVVLSGSAKLVNWQPVADPAVLTLVDPAAKGKLLCADVERPQNILGFANGGCGFCGKPEYPVALYQEGKRLPVSRWPNDHYAKMGECLGGERRLGTRRQVHPRHLPVR
jgi:hypothetical protein